MSTEIAAILAPTPPGVLSLAGGFPNPRTFPTDEIAEIVARLLRDEPAVALQYGPSDGIRSVREYLCDRQEQLQGRRPALEELMVTSGGMECIALTCRGVLEPGDTVVVEAPTYLGALMAFESARLEVEGVPIDEDGLLVDALEERLEAGLRPQLLYVIPEYQNPSGRTLPLERRQALVELCRKYSVLIFEDIAYREITFDGSSLPSLWSLGPDVVLQAGTFSKVLSPGTRLGWAVARPDVIAKLASAKQLTDQCATSLGQRIVEEYGRAGHFERGVPAASELYATHWRALDSALRAHMPEGVTWSRPTGGFFSWVEVPVDALELRPAALEAGVTYVPGALFGGPPNTLRLSFSLLDEADLESAVARLASVIA